MREHCTLPSHAGARTELAISVAALIYNTIVAILLYESIQSQSLSSPFTVATLVMVAIETVAFVGHIYTRERSDLYQTIPL